MIAGDYARRLLADVGAATDIDDAGAEHPAVGWAASGLMDVTGRPEGPGLMCPVPVAALADGAVLALGAMALGARAFGARVGPRLLADLRGAALLGQRARLMGLTRKGTVSAGGACRLLQAVDGWIAISLARDEDWNCVDAWLQSEGVGDWPGVAAAARDRDVRDLLMRGRELGLAVARADDVPMEAAWCRVSTLGEARLPANGAPVVLDLSALWAGPLCGALLCRAGAVVAKVESVTRPDGARRGHGGFFDFLNGGKSSVALDLRGRDGVDALRRMIARADIVIESARPRAMRQLGIDAEEMVAGRPGLTWVSITGHGRAAPQGEWTGFGDDSAAAGGFCEAMHVACGDRVFCGDALADPLTGLHAAVAAWAAWRQGGGRIVALSLSEVSAHCVAQGERCDLAERAADWAGIVRGRDVKMVALPKVLATARALGADTREMVAALC